MFVDIVISNILNLNKHFFFPFSLWLFNLYVDGVVREVYGAWRRTVTGGRNR